MRPGHRAFDRVLELAQLAVDLLIHVQRLLALALAALVPGYHQLAHLLTEPVVGAQPGPLDSVASSFSTSVSMSQSPRPLARRTTAASLHHLADLLLAHFGGGPVHAVSAEVREEEIRQMVQARSDRGLAKGREALDVEAEVEKLLATESSGPGLGADRGLREEVRQLVVARNERRQRQGKEPLDVDQEIDRQLRELENLGQ